MVSPFPTTYQWLRGKNVDVPSRSISALMNWMVYPTLWPTVKLAVVKIEDWKTILCSHYPNKRKLADVIYCCYACPGAPVLLLQVAEPP